MYENRIYSDITIALPDLFAGVIRHGLATGSRNGDVKELTHVGITLEAPLLREILVPTRKANLAAQIAETMWVLSGRDDMAFLSNYLPRATQFSDDKTVWRGGYGKRLRAWPRRNDGDVIDQVRFVVELLKEDPLTRRAVAVIYDPDVDDAPGLDIPCNNWLHFLQRDGVVDLHVSIRSNDLMWGWSGINQFEWSALLEVVARLAGFKPGALHFSISSLHVYAPHWDKGRTISDWGPHSDDEFDLIGDLQESPTFALPTLDAFDEVAAEWFALEEAIRTGQPHRSVETIADPMLRSWLRVIEWWWSGDESYLIPLEGTRLHRAAKVALQPPAREVERVTTCDEAETFADFVIALHAAKNAAYGDSWKRRGEMLGIMANIARKIDRLGVGGAGDTAADTAIDLLVYLVKYRLWLTEFANAVQPWEGSPIEGLSDGPAYVAKAIRALEGSPFGSRSDEFRITYLRDAFEGLEAQVMSRTGSRYRQVERMIAHAYPLARSLWEAEQRA